MKSTFIFHTLSAFCISALAIACQAQNTRDTTVDHALFEELYDHEWFVEYRELHQRTADMILYGTVDLQALRPFIYTEGFDFCDPYATADVSKIRGADDYFNHTCDKGSLYEKMMAKYPEVIEMSSEARRQLLYNSNQITRQEAENIIDIRRSSKPD